LELFEKSLMEIDINCDLGENIGSGNSGIDELIMPYISSANIACGFHAGNPFIIEKTVMLARKYSVSIGAHPSYPDRENFGRRTMKMSDTELRETLIYQISAVKVIAEASGERLAHVKPHGALYNDAAVNYGLAHVIVKTIKEIDRSLLMYGPAGSQLSKAASEEGIKFVEEFFADRAYNDNGSLVARNIEGSVLHDTNTVIGRVIKMVIDKEVITITGKPIPISADTVCIHGDNEMAPMFASELMSELKAYGINVKPVR
jgi:5-oxoprolinase (ATP-hydrolysing) subunit A